LNALHIFKRIKSLFFSRKAESNFSKTFCIAAWSHLQVAPSGKRKLCCVAKNAPDEVNQLPWKDFLGSAYIRKIRQKMLTNQIPDECRGCYDLNRTTSYRDTLNQEFSLEVDKVLRSSDPLQYIESPVYIDYRNNICNLSCRTCGPHSSSAYLNIINRNLEYKKYFEKYDHQYYKDIQQHFNKFYYSEILEFIHHKRLKKIYFAGGEPLADKNHINILREAIRTGVSKSIRLFYNTNLLVSKDVLSDWLPLLAAFKEVTINVSMDGVGAVNDFIRRGSKFDKLIANITFLKNACSKEVSIRVDITLTSLNIYQIEDFARMAIDLGLPIESKLMICGEEQRNSYLMCEVISPADKNKIIERWNEYYYSLTRSEKRIVSGLHLTIELFATKDQFLYENSKELKSNFLRMENITQDDLKVLSSPTY
jgi:sulfatase maturation enzyme AslB (radical SAM superfamily)